MIDIRATTIFVINRNSRCPFFLFSKKIILLSAFIYECVDQPRKWMFQGDWGCATTSFLHRIRIHALLADFVPNSTQIRYNEFVKYKKFHECIQHFIQYLYTVSVKIL